MVAFETNAKRETFQISRGHACWRGDVDAYRNADYDQALDNQIEDFSHRCYIEGNTAVVSSICCLQVVAMLL